MDLCITVFVILYDKQSSYFGVNLKVTPIDVGANARGLRLSVTVCLALVLWDWLKCPLKKCVVAKGLDRRQFDPER